MDANAEADDREYRSYREAVVLVAASHHVAPESSEKSRLTAASVDRLECNQVHEQINGTSNAADANEADEI